MSLADLKRNVVTTYKADTSQMKKAIGELREETAKLGTESKKTTSDFDKLVAVSAKVTGAIASAKIVWDGFNSSIERSRLSAAAAGANIERLKAASLGLKTEMQLLADAAQFQSGAFKLNQQQMEIAERAMVAFSRKGVETAKAQKAVTDAVVELKTDGLADLGVFIDKTGLSMDSANDRAKIFERTMQALAKAGIDVKDGQRSAGEGAQAAVNDLSDAWTRLKQGIGELAIAFTPILDALSKFIGLAADAVKALKEIVTAPKRAGRGILGALMSGSDAALAMTSDDPFSYANDLVASKQQAIDASGPGYLSMLGSGFNEFGNYIGGVSGRLGKQLNDPWAAERQKGSGQRGPGTENIWGANYLDDLQNALIDMVHNISTAVSAEREAQTSSVLASASSALGMGTDSNDLQNQLHALYGKGNYEDGIIGKRNAEAYKSFNKSKLEEMFGPIEDVNGYTMAFQALSGAVGAALSAWIDGSASAGEAIKQFIADAMKANAIQMAAEAVKHGAYALGSLAFGDARGAATHGAAALKFGVAAAAFAVGAKAMGGSGATGAGAGGGAAPTYSAGANSAPAEKHTTIVVGSAFLPEGSPRQRQLAANKIVESALGSGGVTYAS